VSEWVKTKLYRDRDPGLTPTLSRCCVLGLTIIYAWWLRKSSKLMVRSKRINRKTWNQQLLSE